MLASFSLMAARSASCLCGGTNSLHQLFYPLTKNPEESFRVSHSLTNVKSTASRFVPLAQWHASEISVHPLMTAVLRQPSEEQIKLCGFPKSGSRINGKRSSFEYRRQQKKKKILNEPKNRLLPFQRGSKKNPFRKLRSPNDPKKRKHKPLNPFLGCQSLVMCFFFLQNASFKIIGTPKMTIW